MRRWCARCSRWCVPRRGCGWCVHPRAISALRAATAADEQGATFGAVTRLGNLLARALELDPDRRLQVREILEHPFFTDTS